MKHCSNKEKDVTVSHFTRSKELPQRWDDFIPASHFLSRGSLSNNEAANLPDISFIYILVEKNNEPLLCAGFQVLSLRSEHINNKLVKGWQHLLWQAYTGIIHPKLVIGGHLFRHDINSMYCAGTLSHFESYQYYKQAIDKAIEISCASAVLIKDMPEKLAPYFRNFEPQYIMLRNDISMEMSIPGEWQNIDDYEKALKHKYAQRFRKIRQPWQQLDIKEFSARETEEHKNELYNLYMQVCEHQQVRMGLLSPEFIPVLKKYCDDKLRVWGIYEAGKLIAFFSAWVKETIFDMFYIGFDYEKNKELNLYFNILYFSIEQAILSGKETLQLGRTALDAKARLGCKPRYLSTFLYIRNSIVRQRIMQVQKNTTDKEGAWEARHPFGKSGH